MKLLTPCITIVITGLGFTFGFLMPWIISNNALPLWLCILLFMVVIGVWFYFIEKLIRKLISEVKKHDARRNKLNP